MIRSHGARAALCVVLAVALAGCIENRYRSDASVVDVVTDERSPTSNSSTEATTSPLGPTDEAPALAHQGPAEAEGYTLEGYRVYADDGRLWVFEAGSDDLDSFLAKGEPAKRVTLIGEGPDGKTLLGSDTQVMRDYALATRHSLDGFAVFGREGRLWVFRRGSEDLATFLTKGEPAKRVTLIGEGPGGITLMGSDRESMKQYAEAVTK